MLSGLFVVPSVTAIAEALTSARASAARRLTNARADLSTIEDGSLDAVVGVDIASDAGWEPVLREWSRVVRDGGAIVMVDRGHASETSRRALCAGLSELEQRHAGR